MRNLPLAFAALLALAAPSLAAANGNVTTERTNKGVTIAGDSGANEFEVKYGTDTQGNPVLVVEGKNGTTVNGQAKFEVALPGGAGKLDQVLIRPGTGEDKVTVDLTGLPEDRRFSSVEVTSGHTTTLKNIQLQPRGKLKLGVGVDTTVEGCDVGNLNVETIGGTITIKDCNITGKLKIELSTDGTLNLEDSFYGETQIRGDGTTNVQPSRQSRIERTTGKKVSYTGGVGDDEVAFEDNVIESVSVKLGDGADLVSFTGSDFEKTSVDGGTGALDCFDDMADGNAFGAFKTKGFEDGACSGFVLEFGDPGQDPFAEPPDGAVAWLVSNGSHEDGPFALPGAENPEGLPELDPASLPAPAHWGQGPECVDGMTQLFHVHDDFAGHDDPDAGGCGHGVLSWGFLVPI